MPVRFLASVLSSCPLCERLVVWLVFGRRKYGTRENRLVLLKLIHCARVCCGFSDDQKKVVPEKTCLFGRYSCMCSRTRTQFTPYTVHITRYTILGAQYTHSTKYTVHSSQYKVHSTQYAVRSTQGTKVKQVLNKTIYMPAQLQY